PAATESIPPSYKVPLHDGNAILNRQRLNRPVSPHLTIYQTQIPWTLSALNRITGSVLSGGFYVFGFAYLVSPLLGWHIESAALAQSFAELPTLVKGGLKFLVALPFTFHSFNGVRHLIWDSGREFANKSVVRTGKAASSKQQVVTNHYHILCPTSSHDPVQDTVVRDVVDNKEAEPPNDRHDERHTKAESVISDDGPVDPNIRQVDVPRSGKGFVLEIGVDELLELAEAALPKNSRGGQRKVSESVP
ncbi:MAG: hypothetical protein Q9193_003658, partial [Seirophora villosa]